MQRAVNGRGDFVEYELNGEIKSALGLTLDQNSFRIARTEHILQRVYVHDDCFFAIEPVNEAELRCLTQAILEQHSFYLGADVDWANIPDEIIALLRRVEKVRMQSEPRRRRVILSWKDPGTSFIGRILKRGSRQIRIQNGVARHGN